VARPLQGAETTEVGSPASAGVHANPGQEKANMNALPRTSENFAGRSSRSPLVASAALAALLIAACTPGEAPSGDGGGGSGGGWSGPGGGGSAPSGGEAGDSTGPGSGGGGGAVTSTGAAGGPDPAAQCAPACEAGTVCVAGTCESSPSGIAALDALLLGKQSEYDAQLMVSQQPDLSWAPSSIYHWADFLQALYAMHLTGVGEKRIWFGDASDDEATRTKLAAVNVAAFIAQSMVETIKYDACDENNWDTGYPITSACGQLGQNYENYDCELACPKRKDLRISAVTHAKWYGAPGPLFCAPDQAFIDAGLSATGATGRWDYNHDCWPYPATEPNFTPADTDVWSRPECQVYDGQKAGRWVWDGSAGSVEGCCWWGRGVIQTTGRCNFGTLNHYLGKTHVAPGVAQPPAKVLYPDVDFCADPEVICASDDHPELKWVAGLFYWMSSVQTYEKNGWKYLEELRAFVDGGMTDMSFIDGVSGIVNRGCHDAPCGTGELHNGPERKANFQKVLSVMGLTP
jgi:hypothetical protein